MRVVIGRGRGVLHVHLDAAELLALEFLARSSAVPNGEVSDVLAHLIASALDGVRRPGSWERGWLHQAFGGLEVDDGGELR